MSVVHSLEQIHYIMVHNSVLVVTLLVVGSSSFSTSPTVKSSHIVSIKSSNIGLAKADIKVDFGQEAGTSLIAITGESGTGKSLLVSKAIDLVTGGKTISSLVPSRAGEGNDEDISSFVELSK